jgi:hypothetical protein
MRKMWPPFVALELGAGIVLSASSAAIVGNAPVLESPGPETPWSGAAASRAVCRRPRCRSAARADAGAVGVASTFGAMFVQVRVVVVEASGRAFVDGVHAVVLVDGGRS